MEFLNSSDNLTPSDVVRFVSEQPDFHEYGLGLKQVNLTDPLYVFLIWKVLMRY